MIERLLAADAALERGELDTAEKLFGSVAEADPRNAIAAVGMGRVAAGRDDADGARTWFRRALSIDPDEAAARRLLTALEREVAALHATTSAEVAAQAEGPPAEAPLVEPPGEPRRSEDVAAAPQAQPALPRHPSLIDRIRAWLGLSDRR